ncbi:MAG: hypothetical protein Q9201_003956 [Fulgogasparrea decipioides]
MAASFLVAASSVTAGFVYFFGDLVGPHGQSWSFAPAIRGQRQAQGAASTLNSPIFDTAPAQNIPSIPALPSSGQTSTINMIWQMLPNSSTFGIHMVLLVTVVGIFTLLRTTTFEDVLGRPGGGRTGNQAAGQNQQRSPGLGSQNPDAEDSSIPRTQDNDNTPPSTPSQDARARWRLIGGPLLRDVRSRKREIKLRWKFIRRGALARIRNKKQQAIRDQYALNEATKTRWRRVLARVRSMVRLDQALTRQTIRAQNNAAKEKARCRWRLVLQHVRSNLRLTRSVEQQAALRNQQDRRASANLQWLKVKHALLSRVRQEQHKRQLSVIYRASDVLQVRLRTATDDLAQKDGIIASKAQQLTEAAQKLNAIETALCESRRENSSLEEKLAQSDASAKSLRSQLDDKNRAHFHSKAQENRQQRTIKELNSSLAKANGQIEHLERTRDQVYDDGFDKGCASNEETIKSLRADVSAANDRCDELDSEAYKLKKVVDVVRAGKEQLNNRIHDPEAIAKSKDSNHEKQLKELTGKVSASSKQAKEQKEQAEEQWKKVERLTEQLSVKIEKEKEDDTRIKALTDELAQAKTTITTQQEQLYQASKPAGGRYARGHTDGVKYEYQRRRKWEVEAREKYSQGHMDPTIATVLQAGDFISKTTWEHGQELNGLERETRQLKGKLAKCRNRTVDIGAGSNGAGDSGSEKAGNIDPGVTLSTAEESGVAGSATVEPGTNASGADGLEEFQSSFQEPNSDDKNDAQPDTTSAEFDSSNAQPVNGTDKNANEHGQASLSPTAFSAPRPSLIAVLRIRENRQELRRFLRPASLCFPPPSPEIRPQPEPDTPHAPAESPDEPPQILQASNVPLPASPPPSPTTIQLSVLSQDPQPNPGTAADLKPTDTSLDVASDPLASAEDLARPEDSESEDDARNRAETARPSNADTVEDIAVASSQGPTSRPSSPLPSPQATTDEGNQIDPLLFEAPPVPSPSVPEIASPLANPPPDDVQHQARAAGAPEPSTEFDTPAPASIAAATSLPATSTLPLKTHCSVFCGKLADLSSSLSSLSISDPDWDDVEDVEISDNGCFAVDTQAEDYVDPMDGIVPTGAAHIHNTDLMEGIDTTGVVHIPESPDVEMTNRHDDFNPGHHSLYVPETNGEAEDEDMDTDEDGMKPDESYPSNHNPFVSGTNGTTQDENMDTDGSMEPDDLPETKPTQSVQDRLPDYESDNEEEKRAWEGFRRAAEEEKRRAADEAQRQAWGLDDGWQNESQWPTSDPKDNQSDDSGDHPVNWKKLDETRPNDRGKEPASQGSGSMDESSGSEPEK